VAALLGVAVPLCSCGTLPIALSLIDSGVSPRAVVAFLTAAQSAGLDSAMITTGFLGFQAAGLRLLGALTLALAAGMATPVASRAKQTDAETPAPTQSSVTAKPGGLLALGLSFLELFDEVVVWLTVGILATSLVTMYSEQFAVGAALLPEAAMRVLVPLLSLPLQLCEHGTVAFAGALQKAGITTGTAFAFLISAPATNLASLSLVVRHGGGAFAVARIGTAMVVTSACMAALLDWSGLAFESPSSDDIMPEWFVNVSTYIVAFLAAISGARRLKHLLTKDDKGAEKCCSEGVCTELDEKKAKVAQ